MSCQRVSTDDVGERYLLGQLNEADQEALERHIFTCDECFVQLEVLEAVRERLDRDSSGVPGIALERRRPLGSRLWSRWFRRVT